MVLSKTLYSPMHLTLSQAFIRFNTPYQLFHLYQQFYLPNSLNSYLILNPKAPNLRLSYKTAWKKVNEQINLFS